MQPSDSIRQDTARGGAAGWAAGSLLGLGWAIADAGLTPMAVTGWALGAVVGSVVGVAAAVELRREVVVLRRKQLPPH